MTLRTIATGALLGACLVAAGCQTKPKNDGIVLTVGEDGKMRVVSAGGDPALAAILQSLNDDLAEDKPLAEEEVWRKDADDNLVHIQSGATCPMIWGDYKRTKASIFQPDGMDVGCNYETGGERFMTFYVYRSDLSLAEELKGTMETVKARQPVSKDVAFGMPSANGTYVAATLAYETAQRTQMRTSAILANGGHWRLKVRLTTPAKEATDAERLAAIAIVGQSERLKAPQPSVAKAPPI